MPRTPKRKSTHSQAESRLCTIPDCGRPAYVRGLCQTHHRQMLTTGTTKPIRRYRPRSSGTVKFSGLRLSEACAELLDQRAKQSGCSLGATIADILERWHLAREKSGTRKS